MSPPKTVAGALTIQGGADADDIDRTGTVVSGKKTVDPGGGTNIVLP